MAKAIFKNLKLLIIDDDVDLCDSIKFYFDDYGSKIITSNNGVSGVQIFKREHPDVVLVDLDMPVMRGDKVIVQIRDHNDEIPIIVVSGTGMIKEAVRAITLGAWDFVTKPILNFEELEFSIMKALERSELLRENRKYREGLEHLVEERTSMLQSANKELEIAKNKAEEADRLKTEFLSQMSHEIRTPLNAVIGYIELAKNALDENQLGEMLLNFDMVKVSSNRIIRTMELILKMAEITSGSYEPNYTEFNLCEQVESVMSDYFPVMHNRGLDFTLTNNSKKNRIMADVVSVGDIMHHLIDNAFKYTDDGSIEIKIYDDKDNTILTIKDTGVGISEDYMKNIFKPFSQEEQGYTRTYEGNGLGLALTKKYCDMNNIDINIDSAKGKGTQIKLSFINKQV